VNEAGHLAQRDSGSGRPGRQGGRGPAGAGSEVGEAAQPGPLEGGLAVSLTEGVRAIGNGGWQLVRGHSGNFEGERRRAGHHSGDLRRERHRAGHHSGQKEPLVAACRPRRRHPRPHGTAWGQPFAASAVAGQAWPTRPRGPHSLPRTVPAPVAVSVAVPWPSPWPCPSPRPCPCPWPPVPVPVSAPVPVPVAAPVPVSVPVPVRPTEPACSFNDDDAEAHRPEALRRSSSRTTAASTNSPLWYWAQPSASR